MIFSFDEKVYNFSTKRLRDIFEYSSAEGEPNYAKSYAMWIKPLDYLSLTCPDIQSFIDKAQPLDYKKLCAERQEIYLRVDFNNGRVVGHEGRHRMAALYKAGANLVAITVCASDEKDKYNRQFIEKITVKGQEFDYLDPPCSAPGVVDLKCLIPVNVACKDTLYECLGPRLTLETFIGKKVYAVDDIYQFSSGDKVASLRQSVGTVKGLSDNPEYIKTYDPFFPWQPSYVWLHNEKNPLGYKDFAVKASDFMNWIKEGKYQVPAKDLMESLDDLIGFAEGIKQEQLCNNVKHSLETNCECVRS